ncbi:MAG: DUF3160 domain-containing protein [Synergistaceae bacterium]|nr:DUF3160 domain-containing protein [Synergistaceae bacterium]
MKKILILSLLITSILIIAFGCSLAAAPVKMKLDAATIKAMSIFISNFTELDMYEISDAAAIPYGELVHFGVGHNVINNPKQIKKAGSKSSVTGKQVGETVKKYFALDIKPSASAEYDGAKYDFSKGSFEFTKPANRTTYYARVSEAYMDGGKVLMTGEVYNVKNTKEIRGQFHAYAKPWKYGGKDTWALLSLHEGSYSAAKQESASVVAQTEPKPTSTPETKPAPKPQAPVEGEYVVVAEILPIMESPGHKYVIDVNEEDGEEYLEYSDGLVGAVVYGNKLKLRPDKNGWFALLSPADESVLGYIPGGGVQSFPECELTGGALYMVARDNPGLSLTPDAAVAKDELLNRGLSLLKGEVVKSYGKRGDANKVLLSFGTLSEEGGVGDRYAWADGNDLIALSSYAPDNTKADRALIPSVRRLNAWGDEDQILEKLSDGFVESLEKRGFLIDGKPLLPEYGVFIDDMADLYQGTGQYEADFITTDIFLHSFHLVFDQMLQKFERTFLSPKLAESLDEIIGQMNAFLWRHIEGGMEEPSFVTAVDIFTVARALLSGEYESDLLSAQAKNEVKKILEASTMEDSEITGQKFDYTLLKPRGHYTLSPQFERYFRAMSYLGLAELPLFDKGTPIPHNIKTSAMLTMALDLNIDTWKKFEDPIGFLVGVPNAGDPDIYREVVRNRLGEGAEAWGKLGDESLMAALTQDIAENVPGPKIQSVAGIDTKEGANMEDRDAVFRVAPKRFTYDAFILNRLTSPRVGSTTLPRNMPKGTDVMAVFGSQVADALSKSEYEVEKYEANLTALKGEVAGYLAKENTVYASWLEAFRAGFEDSGSEQFFYRSAGWAWKKLATNLASWAELKHDTILYAEQSMAELGDGGNMSAGRYDPPQPRGYVEPDPQFFTAMLSAANYLQTFIRDYGVEEDDSDDEASYIERLDRFTELLESMKDIARKEVAKEALTPDEYASIKETAKAFNTGLLLPGRNSDFTTGDAELRKMAVVADVATNGWDKTVLEVGVGVPRAIYVFANDKSGGARVTKGYVFSYYEFEQPMDKRMTDEEWRTIVYDAERAEELEKFRPYWYEEFKEKTR